MTVYMFYAKCVMLIARSSIIFAAPAVKPTLAFAAHSLSLALCIVKINTARQSMAITVMGWHVCPAE